MAEPIDTTKVQGRRELHFNSLEDIRADVEMLAASQKLRTLGNWSTGQIFQHLTRTMTSSLDGFAFQLPWYFRLMGKFMKKRALSGPMPPGFKLGKSASERLVPQPTSYEDGLRSIRQALDRMKTEEQRAPSPFLGTLSNEEWVQMHCRHSELHLSFIVPDGKA
jgi:hypothetical protein